jgi:MFS superfamily sulfate permease-like transporter
MTNNPSFSFTLRVLIALAALGLALNFMRISADYVISFLMAWIIAAVIILITIVALTPLFYALQEATLGAIVIHAVWHLINFHKISQYRKITSLDFWTAVIATLGVLALGILQGLMLAVFIGLLALIIGTKTRSTSVLGRVPGENIFRGLENYPDGET